jgi:hypothetical protein
VGWKPEGEKRALKNESRGVRFWRPLIWWISSTTAERVMHVSNKKAPDNQIQHPEQALKYIGPGSGFVASSRRYFSEKRNANIKVIADKSVLEHTCCTNRRMPMGRRNKGARRE